jgi:hypothetical protein
MLERSSILHDMKTRLVITVECGMLQSVIAEHSDLEITVLDYDCEGCGEVDPVESVHEIPQENGPNKLATVRTKTAENDPQRLARILRAVRSQC